jgi:hypothetical protein
LNAPNLFSTALALGASAMMFAAAARAEPDAAYLAGYATAVIERDLGLKVSSLEVRNGVAYLVVESLEDQPEERIVAALTEIEGIEGAEVSEAEPDDAVPGAEQQPVPEVARESPTQPDGFELLPRVEIFDPLIADPREPHFAAIFQWYLHDPELNHVGSANFGETFALFGGDLWGGRWEIGGMGGVFSIFDLDAASYDLVNSDFFAGLTFSARRNGVSAQLRAYHQSSHLGDEFLLNDPTFDRINLSYEGFDLVISGDPWPWLRLYGGGGVLVNSIPNDLHPLSAQLGAELESPVAFFGNTVRPIAAFDYESREENHWREELSGAAGIQLENPKLSEMRVQILVSWFKGNSPNGQFFVRRIETIGIGAHLWF